MASTEMTAVGRPRPARPGGVRRAILRAGGALAALAGIGWAAILVRPAPFPPLGQGAAEVVPIPGGLPAPVERFYRYRYGNRVPVVRTAVVSGHGMIRPAGPLFLPMRFRFTHVAGQSYRHYIEVTLFGQPVMRVNEWFVGGSGRAELPWAAVSGNPKWDQGANLGMWFEALQWFPAALLADPRVRWEPVDGATALLVVPYGQDEERLVVRFDPATGDMQHFEVMRYRGGEGEKVLYVDGVWFDDGKPWLQIVTDEVALNVAADTALSARGP